METKFNIQIVQKSSGGVRLHWSVANEKSEWAARYMEKARRLIKESKAPLYKEGSNPHTTDPDWL